MITRVLLLVILTFVLVRAARIVLRGVVVGVTGGNGGSRPSTPAVKLVRDPVCGTHVTPRQNLSITAKGTTYYFCSEQCREKFRKV